MFFDRMRRRAGVAGLVTAIAVAMPVLPASAAVEGQPTPLTITPDFASRTAAANAPRVPAAGEVQVAQAEGGQRRLPRGARKEVRREARQSARREVRRDTRRVVRNDARQDARRVVRSDARQAARRTVRREIRRDDVRDARRDLRDDRRDFRRERRDWRVDRSWNRRHYYDGRWYYGYGDDWYDDSGAWVAAGVIGLAAGAIAGAALASPGYGYGNTVIVAGYPAPYTAEWYRQCDLKYRSFRASDGTFLGYDGIRRTCQLP